MTYVNTMEERGPFNALRAWLLGRGPSLRAFLDHQSPRLPHSSPCRQPHHRVACGSTVGRRWPGPLACITGISGADASNVCDAANGSGTVARAVAAGHADGR